MADRETDEHAGRRRTAGRFVLRWGFAVVLGVGLLLDVFSFGTELGKNFVGWDTDVLTLGRQTDLEELRYNMDRMTPAEARPTGPSDAAPTEQR